MNDYNAMSLDELMGLDRSDMSTTDMLILLREVSSRCGARDAILDLAEQLDAEGLILIPGQPLGYICMGSTDWLRHGYDPVCVVWNGPNLPCDAEPIYSAAPLPEGV